MTTTRELTDREYEIADAICEYLRGKGDRDFTASQLARAAKCATHEAHAVLNHLAAASEVGIAGRGGAWRRYREHRHGEVNQ